MRKSKDTENEISSEEFNEFTENIFDTIREPLLAIDKELKVIKASRSFYRFFKVTAGETIGNHIYELGNHQWDIPKLKDLLEKIIPEKNSFDNYEVEHNFSSIGKRVMLLNARQVKRAFGKEKIILLAIEDITERKGKENTLQETHSATSGSLNSLLDLMNAPIIIWDTSMIIKRFNRKFELLSGYDSTEVIDKKIDFLFPKDKIATTLELLKNHLDYEHEVVEIDILTKDNKIKTVLWNSSQIFDEEGENIIATISQDITSRKLAEDALNILETRYRRLFESAKDGILILNAESGKIVDVNPFLIDLLGYSKKEFIEKFIWEIGSFQDIYENKEKFLELQQKEYVRYDDLPLVASDGRKIHVEFVSNVYLANNIKVIQCNIRDNTENWQIKNQISESEEKFRIITENSADAIFITDKDGKYIYVNKQAVDLLGYSKEELLKLTIIDIIPKNTIEGYFQWIQQLLISGSSYSEIELLKKNGIFVSTDLNAVLLPNGWIYGSCRDISKRKQLEYELINAKEKAEESDRLKTAFLHNISHEIRTPMNAIVGFSGFLNDPDLTLEKQKDYTGIIIQSSDQLLAIIDDIIRIASIEAGQEKIQKNEININSICKLISEQFSQKAKDNDVTLCQKTFLTEDEAFITTDASKLTQIISNLISNALKFTQHGSVNFGYEINDNQLEFFVEDTGIGIPIEMQEIIFNRFRQVETTNTRNFGGSGLGLSISKAYVELLGGKMWLSSEMGKGSVFYFSIPYKSTSLKETPETPSIKKFNFGFSTTKTVLIAEDEESNFMLLEEMLFKSGINIIKAVNGIDAYELCKSNPHIDLVLMDLKMPKMDGFEATMRIKELLPDLPIIAQTAFISEADRNRAIECGCSDFIIKPINKKILLSKINEQLHK